MKTPIRHAIVALLTLIVSIYHSPAQGTAFTYQGRLNNGAAPASGTFDLTFTLFTVNSNGLPWAGPVTNRAAVVTNGLFMATIDFGPGVFNGGSYWLEIGVRTNGASVFSTLSPRQPVTPTPYAIMANSASNLLGTLSTAQLTGTFPASQIAGNLPASQLSGTIASSNFSGTYSGPVTFNNGADMFDGTFIGQFVGSSFLGGTFTGQFLGDGSGVINLNASQLASGIVPDARISDTFTRTNQVWLLNGNGGTNPNNHFVGTTDNQPLIFKVNGIEAQRFEPATNSPNLIGGYAGNFTDGGQDFGVTISGGGEAGLPNVIQGTNATFATIAGGAANTISGDQVFHSVISGGSYNSIIGDFAYRSVIGGGTLNTIQGGYLSIIGGGDGNLISSNNYTATIVGGSANNIQYNSWAAFIGAGYNNVVQTGSGYSSIPGGYGNTVHSNAGFSVIGGGEFHSILPQADYSSIAGGYNNSIQGDARYTTINGYPYAAVIGGGYFNNIRTNSDWATIGGGIFNTLQAHNSGSTIGGGYDNIIQGDSNRWVGFFLVSSTIAGGAANTIQPFSSYATIGGGVVNVIGTNSSYSVIAGGNANAIQAFNEESTIGGGILNSNSGWWTTIAGGQNNVTGGNNATVGGGGANKALALSATISGGFANQALFTDAYIGGGYLNLANGYRSVISGGSANVISNQYGVIPGGLSNVVMGAYALAAGQQAQALHDGTFVWADSQPAQFSSTTSNQFAVRATGGVSFQTAGAGMTLDGQPILSGAVLGGQLSGTYTNAVTLNNPANSFSGNGSGLANVNAATLNGLSPGSFWQIGGNSGTTFGVNYLGTSDNVPLDLRVAGERAYRFWPNAGSGAPEVIGGSAANFAVGYGTTIGGGGATNYFGSVFTNYVLADFGTIGGGAGNGIQNNGFYAFIGGGRQNTNNNNYATISGGYLNLANGFGAVIGGGTQNTATAEGATVVGGEINAANGTWSTVAGGRFNTATAPYSLAAGQNAHAVNQGAFVWADSQGTSFSSTANDQFNVRAQGGVGINTNHPAAALHVAGEAIIGPDASAPRFGMKAIHLGGTGNAFIHPGDTNLIMQWDAANRILIVTNAATGYFYDVQMQVTEEDAPAGNAANARDIISPAGPGSLRLTNSLVNNAGWNVTAVREGLTGPGFQFNGTGYSANLSGLITYWY